MWIRSQDRKELVNIIRLNISYMVGGSKKAIIFGTYAGSTLFNENRVKLGVYNSMDDALKELGDIENFMRQKPNEIYRMK